jgi:DNA-binding MarR family transcriptional regulator
MKKAKFEDLSPQRPYNLDLPSASQQPFLPTLQALMYAYKSVVTYGDAHIRQLGLTPAQYEVIVTLGRAAMENSGEMSMGELIEKTLVGTGSLTGIIDRLEAKNLVIRRNPPDDRRSVIVSLTSEGQALFAKVFPAHVAHLKERFSKLDAAELQLLRILLKKVQDVF